MATIRRKVLSVLICALAASGCDSMAVAPEPGPPRPLEPTAALSTTSPPPPTAVTQEEYNQMVATAEIDGTTLAWAGSASVVPAFVEGSMTVFIGPVPAPAYNQQTIYARVAVDQQFPLTRHQTFTGVLYYPWFGRTDKIDMPELDCLEVEDYGHIWGNTTHLAVWPLVVNGVGITIDSETSSQDEDGCNVDGGSNGGGGGFGGGGGGLDCQQTFICIDIWNAQEQRWEEFWCGYADVCE